MEVKLLLLENYLQGKNKKNGRPYLGAVVSRVCLLERAISNDFDEDQFYTDLNVEADEMDTAPTTLNGSKKPAMKVEEAKDDLLGDLV